MLLRDIPQALQTALTSKEHRAFGGGVGVEVMENIIGPHKSVTLQLGPELEYSSCVLKRYIILGVLVLTLAIDCATNTLYSNLQTLGSQAIQLQRQRQDILSRPIYLCLKFA